MVYIFIIAGAVAYVFFVALLFFIFTGRRMSWRNFIVAFFAFNVAIVVAAVLVLAAQQALVFLLFALRGLLPAIFVAALIAAILKSLKII